MNITETQRRYIVLAIGLLALAAWAGPVIAEMGVLGYVLVPLLWLALPAFFCIATPRLPIMFGAVANALTWFSFILFNSRLTRLDRSVNWENVWAASFETRWAYVSAVVFSLFVSIPVQVFRIIERRHRKRYPW